MAGDQKRDSKGRFKEKPKKSAPRPSNVQLPDRPIVKAPAEEDKSGNVKPRIIRLVKSPMYEPVAAVKKMEDALLRGTDLRSRKKRDKARKEMESTFGDIEWDEQKQREILAMDSSTGEPSTLLAQPEVYQASSREELIASSGSGGQLWVLQSETNTFAMVAESVKLTFIYAEDTSTDMEEFFNLDHILVEGEGFLKRFFIGKVAFISHHG